MAQSSQQKIFRVVTVWCCWHTKTLNNSWSFMAEKRRHRTTKMRENVKMRESRGMINGRKGGLAPWGKEKASAEGEGRMAFFGGNEYICFRKMR
ncbi:unnamed protein product [Meloidogyne enterolobii]|uniref:Uncharacterized protein n=1 Tax=Meloidogyne enterolobii TaxID=390850 RepID=A0ACB1B6X4_MELEN